MPSNQLNSSYDAPCRFSWRALTIKVVGGFILDSSMTRDPKRRTVDGLAVSCGTTGDHVEQFGRPPTAVLYQKHSTPPAMLDSRLESPAPSRKSPRLDPKVLEKGGGMRYHGMDLHKKYATISMRNEGATGEKFVRA